MRIVVLNNLTLVVFCINLMAFPAPSDPKPIPEPTAEQLEAAKKAYAKLGAEYKASTNPKTNQTTHIFSMPEKTTDADLKNLPNLPFDFAVSLNSTNITDVGLKELKNLKNLSILFLAKTNVTDAGLKELRELRNLTGLYLGGTQVSDAGLKDLKELKNLLCLIIYETKVTDAGLKELQKALPKCKITK